MRSAKHGTLVNSTDSQRPSRHVARASTTPPGASSRTTVSGSCIGSMPVSSSTVVVQIVLEPDIGGYSVGSMMMKPASQSLALRGDDEVDVRGHAAAGLAQQQPPQGIAVALPAPASARTPSRRAGQHPPTMTLPISPPACAPTTLIARMALTRAVVAGRRFGSGVAEREQRVDHLLGIGRHAEVGVLEDARRSGCG